MAGLLEGLEALGLGDLEKSEIYEEKKAEKVNRLNANKAKTELTEEDIIYPKEFECPVCSGKFFSKVTKYGKAKLVGTDADLKPKYKELEATKYDVALCPHCGYAALIRYFPNLLEPQKKLIKEKISSRIKLNSYDEDEPTSFEEAFERYKLALACAIVKKAKSSEKAYICLKTAWLLRGWRESLEAKGDKSKSSQMLDNEMEYIKTAYSGFVDARQKEPFPIVGMDTNTYEYLLAQLAMKVGDFDSSRKFVSGLLISRDCPERIKDKARDLKEQLKGLENVETE